MVEGYGQTECTAPITLSIQGDMKTEHVGPPVACNLVKLADVPEMEYYASSNQGEICVKGSNIFQGYFKDPNAISFDEHGWHHTGDIGMWLSVSIRKNIATFCTAFTRVYLKNMCLMFFINCARRFRP